MVAIAGFGPGLGEALARRFTREGHVVAGMSRTPPPTDISLGCDVADAASVGRAFDAIEETAPVSILIYNAAHFIRGPFAKTPADEFEQAWRTSALGAFNTAQRALPNMIAARSGTMIFSGATGSLRGAASFSAFASAKFALRGLAQSLARELGPQGIHVAHVVIDGLIWSERTRQRFTATARESCLEPDDLAEAYWNLAAQPRTAWTHELDLRPHAEKY